MSLQQQVAAKRQVVVPFIRVVNPPGGKHTHTVVFLEDFPESITDEQLKQKVFSQKLTSNNRTLREQFPSVRWVFLFGKAAARPWNGLFGKATKTPWIDLTREEKASISMTKATTPYITQIILQEAKRAGGLNRVIFGAQALPCGAAFEVMCSFPECKTDDTKDVALFIQQHFHSASTQLAHLRLAGFVAVCPPEEGNTRYFHNLGMLSADVRDRRKVNITIINNTPHQLIFDKPKYGYRFRAQMGDRNCIDEFALFLYNVGVYRVPYGENQTNHVLAPADRLVKRALKRIEERKADRHKREMVLIRTEAKRLKRIEANKLERIEDDKLERELVQHMLAQNAPKSPWNPWAGRPQSHMMNLQGMIGESGDPSDHWTPVSDLDLYSYGRIKSYD